MVLYVCVTDKGFLFLLYFSSDKHLKILNLFFLEHAGELRINILRRKGEKIPKMLQK